MHVSPLSPSPRNNRTLGTIPGFRIGLILAVLVVGSILLMDGVGCLFSRGCSPARSSDGGNTSTNATEHAEAIPAAPPGLRYVLPTPQTLERLSDTSSSNVYAATESGRLESAFYGSTRRNAKGVRFHEGVDISPTRRDKKGRPLDDVFAVADGRVAYINSRPGNSSYGIYVVLTHDDPMGWIYTLYGHLASVPADLTAGKDVKAGQVIGRMGQTSAATVIPAASAHLHFEIGTCMNTRYPEYMKRRQDRLTHGAWDGRNLYGIDPLKLLLHRDGEGRFSMLPALQAEPVAITFAVAVDPTRLPEYYRRYPGLCELGKGQAPKVANCARLDVSEGGVPLRLRPWPDDEPAPAAKDLPKVHAVNEEALGLNGRGYVTRKSGAWALTQAGRNWLDHLFFR
ncbi:MAG: M23 family metallopeptidase [Kiritimatiellia bacterium]|jgi:murein DD-endopeptidase MepM/ murein hydrolase activator NlpD